MDPLLKIIKYIFKKVKEENNDESLNAFFENGTSFPLLISAIFGYEKIWHVRSNPKTDTHKKKNNDKALQFLFQKNDYIKQRQPTYDTYSDKENLLLLIFTQVYFKPDISEIIKTCNLIVHSLKIQYEEKSDIMNANCILTILNVLTNGRVHIIQNIDQTNNDLDLILTNAFEQTSAPLVVTKSILDNQKESYIMIQFEILFNVFSHKIKKIEKSYNIEKNREKRNKLKMIQKNNSTDDIEDKYQPKCTDFYDKIDKREKKIFSRKIEIENNKNDSLLKMLNIVGKEKFHFNNFYESVFNDTIPRYVMHLFNIESIPNVHLSTKKKSQKCSLFIYEITKRELDNISAVIEFLKKKELTFEILKFDFKIAQHVESSAVEFYSNLLNFFYLKTLKNEMYKRCSILLFTKKYNFEKRDLLDMKTYSALLHLYIEKNLHFDYKSLPEEDEDVKKLFIKANIPMIINNIILDSDASSFPDSVFYQLQLIFDAFDSESKSILILELFLYTLYNINKIKVPPYNIIANNINVKKSSIEFQHVRTDNYLNKKSSMNNSGTEFIQDTPQKKCNAHINTYIERHKSKKEVIQECTIIEYDESFYDFWNPISLDFIYNDGIIYNNKCEQNNSKFQQEWNKIVSNLNNQFANKSCDLHHLFQNKDTTFEAKLYKLFYYDEEQKTWIFDSQVFDQFVNDKEIKHDQYQTPLVFILNSCEEDSISTIFNLITGSYPKLDSQSGDKQIFVYAFCEKKLYKLNYIVNQYLKKKNIKPIFLLLHISKNQENLPNIQSIVYQIYSFLFLISDLNIVILNQNHYHDQINLIRNIYNIKNSISLSIKTYHKEDENQSNSDDDSIYSDNDNSYYNDDANDDNYDDYDETIEDDSWEKEINNENNLYNDELLKMINRKPSKSIFLINDSIFQFGKESYRIIYKNELLKNLKINDDVFIAPINVNNRSTYSFFLDKFIELISKNNSISKISDIKNIMNQINLVKISQIYVDLKNKPDTLKEELRNILFNRFLYLKSIQKVNFKSLLLISKIEEEIMSIFPLYDIDFKNECTTTLQAMYKDILITDMAKDKEYYSSELKISSDSHLSYLNEKIQSNDFLYEGQMDLMISKHIAFLKDEFFNIILSENPDGNISFIYEVSIDILENQIKQDKIKIKSIFKSFLDIINTKKMHVSQNIDKFIKKSTNYSLKETENLKEVKVTVNADKDLKSEIEQDF